VIDFHKKHLENLEIKSHEINHFQHFNQKKKKNSQCFSQKKVTGWEQGFYFQFEERAILAI